MLMILRYTPHWILLVLILKKKIELTKVVDWLKLNKLSIIIKKIKIHGVAHASKTSQNTEHRD